VAHFLICYSRGPDTFIIIKLKRKIGVKIEPEMEDIIAIIKVKFSGLGYQRSFPVTLQTC